MLKSLNTVETEWWLSHPPDPAAQLRLLLPERQRENWFSPRLSRKKFPFFSTGEKHGSADTQFGWRWIDGGWGRLGGWRGWRHLHTNCFTYSGGSKPPPYIGETFFQGVPFTHKFVLSLTCFIGKLRERGNCYIQRYGCRGRIPLPRVWGEKPQEVNPKRKSPNKHVGGRRIDYSQQRRNCHLQHHAKNRPTA